MSKPRRVTSSAIATWNCSTEFAFQNKAVSVCVGVRTVLLIAPYAFTSA